jgi:hypothetical protein
MPSSSYRLAGKSGRALQGSAGRLFPEGTMKKKPGRPPLPHGGAKRVLITIDSSTLDKAARIGKGENDKGNVSLGIRRAVQAYKLRGAKGTG